MILPKKLENSVIGTVILDCVGFAMTCFFFFFCVCKHEKFFDNEQFVHTVHFRLKSKCRLYFGGRGAKGQNIYGFFHKFKKANNKLRETTSIVAASKNVIRLFSCKN